MDWQLAISRNRDALLRIIAALFALAGLAEGQTAATLPRHIYSAILHVLRPAESAVRRLIIISARALIHKFGDSLQNSSPDVLKTKSQWWTELSKQSTKFPTFPLIDPLKRFAPFDEHVHARAQRSIPRISLPGIFDPVFRVPLDLSADDPINAATIFRRLMAIKRALENLSAQARRLARWQAHSNAALQNKVPFKPRRVSPYRPGCPPGTRVKRKHEVDHVLRECHLLMLDMFAEPNTS